MASAMSVTWRTEPEKKRDIHELYNWPFLATAHTVCVCVCLRLHHAINTPCWLGSFRCAHSILCVWSWPFSHARTHARTHTQTPLELTANGHVGAFCRGQVAEARQRPELINWADVRMTERKKTRRKVVKMERCESGSGSRWQTKHLSQRPFKGVCCMNYTRLLYISTIHLSTAFFIDMISMSPQWETLNDNTEVRTLATKWRVLTFLVVIQCSHLWFVFYHLFHLWCSFAQ